MTSKTETGFKVVSTYRKTGKTTTLDPNFLDRRAAQELPEPPGGPVWRMVRLRGAGPGC
jgi:hypothetical protein